MHQQCPSCQKTLQVPEQYIGQQMQCPLCKNTFTVPGTPETAPPAPEPPVTPEPPASPPPVQETPPASEPPADAPSHTPAPPTPQATEPPAFGLAPDPEPSAPPPQPFAPVSAEPPAQPPETAPVQSTPTYGGGPPMVPLPETTPQKPAHFPPVDKGEYAKAKVIWISPRVIPWITPIGLAVLFIFSFLPWITIFVSTNLWSMGGLWVTYGVFVILAMVMSILVRLWAVGVIPDLPQLQSVKPFRSLLFGIFNLVAFVLLVVGSIIYLFDGGFLPYSLWGYIAIHAHLLTVIASFCEICLERRGSKPVPRIEFKW